MEEQNVPQLRFPEFVDSLSNTRLGRISKFSKGKGISKSDVSSNGLDCIRYGELYTTYAELIDETISKTDLNPNQLVISEENDLIIPASGETAVDIATASCVKRSGIALGGDINIVKSEEDSRFLAYYLNGKKRNDIARYAQGSSVIHLYSTQLKLIRLNLPTVKEQQKIASFLSAVDKKIEQLTRKKKLLEEYKKGVMQKLFPQPGEQHPELRFKDVNGEDFPDWEVKRLGEIADRITNKNTENKYSFVLTNSATQGIVSQTDYFDKDIANQNNLDGYYIVEQDDFVYNPRISVHAPVGPIKRNTLETGVMSPLYSVFRFSEDSIDYFESFFETTVWHKHMHSVANYGARHDRMNITVDDFMSLPIPFPNEKERDKITYFLNELNLKIHSSKKELGSMLVFKKGLLQQMFV